MGDAAQSAAGSTESQVPDGTSDLFGVSTSSAPGDSSIPVISGDSAGDCAIQITAVSETKHGSEVTKLLAGAPRPTGLKLPSRIGRLCSHTALKPAIPVSPRSTDGGYPDSLRKYSDDNSRKQLSASSTHSTTHMDTLWERHPRKLSEAGLRRSSEHSVVLTEDTDGFIIGDRVWVGGSKPGQIAYIGETQFAPGDWAGVALDEPIGKNDGSVAGVRYFQCAERRGVFSRLTRLTRAPLVSPRSPHAASPASDAGSVFAVSNTPLGARQRRALSPNGSVRSAISSRMNTSATSTAGEVRVGDRVIVSSSRGSKAGVLRYCGPAQFAAGLWCGVELDDPIGKNDGSVEGERYFECAPRFGLFAPLSKVSRSPSNRKPGNCAIHSNSRVRRSNSRESLTSLGTSVVSSVKTTSRVRPPLAQRGTPRAAATPVTAKNALQVQYIAAR